MLLTTVSLLNTHPLLTTLLKIEAVHMRIESDWYNTAYSKNKDVPYCVMKQAEEGRWFCYSPAEILRSVKNSRDEMNAQVLILLYSQPAEQFVEGTGEGPIETAKR